MTALAHPQHVIAAYEVTNDTEAARCPICGQLTIGKHAEPCGAKLARLMVKTGCDHFRRFAANAFGVVVAFFDRGEE